MINSWPAEYALARVDMRRSRAVSSSCKAEASGGVTRLEATRVNSDSAPKGMFIASLSQAADVYAYGVCCWEIATRRVPYHGMNVNTVQPVKQALPSRVRTPPPLTPLLLFRTLQNQTK